MSDLLTAAVKPPESHGQLWLDMALYDIESAQIELANDPPADLLAVKDRIAGVRKLSLATQELGSALTAYLNEWAKQ